MGGTIFGALHMGKDYFRFDEDTLTMVHHPSLPTAAATTGTTRALFTKKAVFTTAWDWHWHWLFSSFADYCSFEISLKFHRRFRPTVLRKKLSSPRWRRATTTKVVVVGAFLSHQILPSLRLILFFLRCVFALLSTLFSRRPSEPIYGLLGVNSRRRAVTPSWLVPLESVYNCRSNETIHELRRAREVERAWKGQLGTPCWKNQLVLASLFWQPSSPLLSSALLFFTANGL